MRTPAVPSGLVSENSATSANRLPGLAQPSRSQPTSASRTAALDAMSSATAQPAPMRSSSAPATGLTTSPGATSAKLSQPASAGDAKRPSA